MGSPVRFSRSFSQRQNEVNAMQKPTLLTAILVLATGLHGLAVNANAEEANNSSAWHSAEGVVDLPLREIWTSLLGSHGSSYLPGLMAIPDGGNVVAENGQRQLVHFLSESGPPKGRYEVQGKKSVVGIFRTDTGEMEPGLANEASYFVSAKDGCWIGIQTYLFYGDVDSDGKIDIGRIDESVYCNSLADPRKHEFSQLYWKIQSAPKEEYEAYEPARWRQSYEHGNQCPPGGVSLFYPTGDEPTAVDFALERNPQIDAENLDVPECLRRILGLE